MTTADIILYRLFNQQIAQTTFTQPPEIVAYAGAMQAQEYAMAKWAIALRLPGMNDAWIEKAFNDGAILRTHLLRPTWHFVSPADIRWMLALTAPRVHAINAFMYRKLEIDSTLYTQSNDILVKALQGGKQLTRAEIKQALTQEKILTDGLRLGYLMMRAELDGIICSGARKGNQFTYALLDERVPLAKILTMEEALAELVRRFFTSRGPATLQDFVYWSGLTMQAAKEGLAMVKQYFEQVTIEGISYIFAPSPFNFSGEFQKTFLMPDYDEYGMSYKNRNVLSSPANDSLETNKIAYNRMIIVDGLIKGTWKRTVQKNTVLIQLQINSPLTDQDYQAVVNAAEKYGAFLGKQVQIEPEA